MYCADIGLQSATVRQVCAKNPNNPKIRVFNRSEKGKPAEKIRKKSIDKGYPLGYNGEAVSEKLAA